MKMPASYRAGTRAYEPIPPTVIENTPTGQVLVLQCPSCPEVRRIALSWPPVAGP